MSQTQANDELYPLLDMHRQHLAYIDSAEVRRLRSLGVVQGYGTKKRTHGYHLTVSTTKVAGYDYSERSMVPANYCGTRYVFRERLGDTIFHAYRLRKMDVTESPAHSLLRILTPFALEAPTYQPLSTCTEEERLENPATETRKRAREIFRLGRLAITRKAVTEEARPKYTPVCAPLLPVALPVAA